MVEEPGFEYSESKHRMFCLTDDPFGRSIVLSRQRGGYLVVGLGNYDTSGGGE